MGATAASRESKLNLAHYNIVSEEGKLDLDMIAQLNCVPEGFCIKLLELFFPPRCTQTHAINSGNGWTDAAQDLSILLLPPAEAPGPRWWLTLKFTVQLCDHTLA